MIRLCVLQLLCTLMHNPPPLLLLESLLWFWRWIMPSARYQQVKAGLSYYHHTAVTNQVASSSCEMCGCFLWTANSTIRHPRFSFLSLCHLRRLLEPITIHRDPIDLDMSPGKFCVWWKSLVTAVLDYNPALITSWWTYCPWQSSSSKKNSKDTHKKAPK